MSVIMKVYLFNFCVVLCGLVHWGRASFITPCHEEDVKCLKMSAEKALPVLAAGVPEFGIAKMDPMLMDRVKTNQAGLEMDFRNTTVTGLSNCRVLNLKRAGLRTYLDLKCSVDLEGDYTFGGKLLIMPIQGDGKYTTKIRGILVKIQFKVGEKMVNGVKYWTVIDWKHSAEVLKGVHFKYENLFNGNKILSDAVHQFANENWRGIFQEVSPPIVKTIVSQILQQVTKLFDHVPVQELAIE